MWCSPVMGRTKSSTSGGGVHIKHAINRGTTPESRAQSPSLQRRLALHRNACAICSCKFD